MVPAPFFEDLAEGPVGGAAWWLTANDGVRLRAGSWPGGDKGTVLLFPGRTEFIEKYGRTATALAERGFGTLTIDWRGQGLADRLAEDPMLGHVGKFRDYQRDVAAMVDLAHQLDLPRPWYLMGHSMGGCIGLRALHDGLPVSAAAFSAPMWGLRMSPQLRPAAWSLSYLSRYVGLGLRYAPSTVRESYVMTAPFEDNCLTGDADFFAYMKRQVEVHPELQLGGPSLHWLFEALLETRRLRRMPAPKTPGIAFVGTEEEVTDPQPIKDYVKKWPAGTLHVIDGARHEFPMERPAIRNAFLDAAARLFVANSRS